MLMTRPSSPSPTGMEAISPGSAYCHILGDFIDVVEEDDTDVALFEVHGYAFDAVFELHEFVGTNFVEAIDVRNAVSDFE